jgi:hypothetical protein
VNVLERVALAFFVASFVFSSLSAIDPRPSDPARGDNRTIDALIAAFAAAGIAGLIS